MPPEPLPWERKEYAFKDHRRHERGEAFGGSGGGSSSSLTWRESYHGSCDFSRASPRRYLSVRYRQGGGYHQVYPEDSAGRVFTPSRSDRFWMEDDDLRLPSTSCFSGCRSNGSIYSRENRGSLRQSPGRDGSDVPRQQHHQETNTTDFPRRQHRQETNVTDFSRGQHREPNATDFPRLQHDQEINVTSHRSVTALVSSTSQTSPNNNYQSDVVDDGLGSGQIFDHRDHSLGSIPWKKWSRSSSAKNGRTEMDDAGTKLWSHVEKETFVQAPVASSFASTESAFKKPRIGWGQGLAKYEKQKVEGFTEPSVGACLSPSTTCSTTCSSSPGTEDKFCSRVRNNDTSLSQNNDLPGSTFPSSYEEVLANLDCLQVNSMSLLDSLLADLAQPEDAFGGDSNLMRLSMNKVLELKLQASNAYEKIENKIDLLEKELKAMICDTKADAYLDSLKSADAAASELSKGPLDDLLIEHNHLKDQRMECVELLALEDNEHRSSRIFVEHETVAEETVSSAFKKEPFCSSLEKSAASASLIEGERLKATELSDMVEGRLMVPSEVDRGSFANDSICVCADGNVQGMPDSNLVNIMNKSNRGTSKLSWEEFDMALSKNLPQSDIWGFVNFTSLCKHGKQIKEKLSIIKCQQKFKLRLLALKFRVLHQSWRNKKLRTKLNKQSELSNPSIQNSSQKQRSSNRSRSASTAGKLSLGSTTKIMHSASKLLSDLHIKPFRNHLKMPSLLNDKSQRYDTFVNNNGLIEDPLSFENERAMINPWTQEEKEVFMEMLARYGKDFIKISSFLDHKSIADCVEFYYKNHKSESFKNVKKQLDLRKQQQSLPANTYLVSSRENWNHRKNVESLDLLSAASVMVAQNEYTEKIGNHAGNISSRNSVYLFGIDKVNISSQERESMAPNVLAGVCRTRSSETISSHETSSIDPAKKIKDETNLGMDATCFSDEGCGEMESADWIDEEKTMFIQALSMYGKNFTRIAYYVKTKSKEQCKIFFSKARKCLSLDAINQGCATEVKPVNPTNRGRSDTDDTCCIKTNSAVCSTQSCSKIDDDVSQPVATNGYEGITHCASTDFHVETERSHEQDSVVDKGILEGKDKVDKQVVSISHDVKQTSNVDNLQSDVPLKENIVTPSGCEAVKCEAADSAGEANFDETRSIISLPGPAVLIRKSEPVAECLKPKPEQITASISPVRGTVGCSPVESTRKEVDSKSPFAAEVGLSNKKSTNISSIANENGLPLCAKASVQIGSSIISANTCPSTAKNLQSILLEQEDKHSVPLNSFLSDPSNICFEGSPCTLSKATFKSKDHGIKGQKLIKMDLDQQYMLTNLPLTQVDHNMHIMKSSPLHSLKQEANGETNPPALEQLSQHQAENRKDSLSQPNHFLASDKHQHESNISTPHSVTTVIYPSENQSEAKLRTCFKNVGVDEEKPRPGDLKLFGKILSTSTLKSGSSSHGYNQRSLLSKMDDASKMTDSSKVKGASQLVNAGSGQVNLETTYGFWDGKRIQTGFSSLPETASIFYKYQGTPTSTSHYLAKDNILGCNGRILTDYQQPYMQPLPSNLKQIETIRGLQKRTIFNMIPGFQQQVRVTPLSTNMMGGRMLVGGAVSNSVASVNMHFSPRAKVLGSDMDLWRGDMGGRL
ncbi:uncharacterized protein LOC122043319 isoform X1 [Zingiber officinale]|uniref:SANT domain-containing protein n=3 Tax=Zingiber officinale TaxID=94328 RepID=A0A8J5M0K5_ZINOF|nr:uncharacterized protein LOC122043319 isoform X1 [Zingiber officinale]KAG6530447.1 hypothetical protein ZIOFF_012686 [Zingiber officinale]